jgi:two-component system CheB/CheR fusion protein
MAEKKSSLSGKRAMVKKEAVKASSATATEENPPRKSSERSKGGGKPSNTANRAQTMPAQKVSPPIVGVGASAGGLEAITQLLEAVSADIGMAFVIIQHLSPTHDSALTELLARATNMPVVEVTDGMMVEANHVYVMPPDKEMAILGARLQLMPRQEETGIHLPIDYFLRSLARDQGSKAIGVILSGAASDGAIGLKMIKGEGGITFAQDEESAGYDSMPHAAIITGCVDFVLPPAEIALELSRLSRHPYVETKAADVLPGRPDTLNKIFILLRDHAGVDFTCYKQSTIKRRINRRMLLHKLDRLEDYLAYLQSSVAELGTLYYEMLIHVTEFFRESDGFEALKHKVITGLIAEREPDQPIRVWVPGCSTGEEAYSVAICLVECMDESQNNIPVQIFATDVDDGIIEKARTGIYPENISLNVSANRLHRFFNKVQGGYQISKNIRDMCVFARQDITRDPPFSRLDIISCHNLLIYLQPVLQKKVLQIFHYALNPGGCLILGSSESIGGHADLFTLLDKKNRIYRNKFTGNRPSLTLKSIFNPDAGAGLKQETVQAQASIDIQQQIDSFIASKYGPAGVVINEAMDVLRFFGDTSAYLIHTPGKASLNLLKLVCEGLIIDVHKLVTSAIKLDCQQLKSGIRMKLDGGIHFVDIEVLPVKGCTVQEPCYLVLFRERAGAPKLGQSLEKIPEKAPAGASESGMTWRIRELEQELAASREYMRSVIEEQENIVQELQIANEEAQSSNEELRSTNEELETTTEELQVTNEELVTVNDELLERSRLLKQLNSDYENLLRSLAMPIIMLDKDLHIRSLTSAVEQMLALSGRYIGRHVQYLESIFNINGLARLARETMAAGAARRIDIQHSSGRWYSLQLSPYVTEEKEISGVVLVLTDISERKAAGLKLARLAAIVESSDDAIIGKTLDGTITDWNRGAERLYGYSAGEAIGQNISMLAQADRADEFTEIAACIKKGERIDHYKAERIAKDGSARFVSLSISPVLDEEGHVSGISTIARDISKRKNAT